MDKQWWPPAKVQDCTKKKHYWFKNMILFRKTQHSFSTNNFTYYTWGQVQLNTQISFVINGIFWTKRHQFAPCKVIQESLGFRIPYLWIPDSTSMEPSQHRNTGFQRPVFNSYSSRTRWIWADIYNQRGRRPSWLLSAHIRQVREEYLF